MERQGDFNVKGNRPCDALGGFVLFPALRPCKEPELLLVQGPFDARPRSGREGGGRFRLFRVFGVQAHHSSDQKHLAPRFGAEPAHQEMHSQAYPVIQTLLSIQ